ncbi:MAG TPA: nitroreductase family protein [Paludibacteraceae bacterium]|nr:nitroreductase family protein [Paludibacteraceae bacterium]HQB69634.1 nitroreductase family protein [Paludibacteraceae bacterium]
MTFRDLAEARFSLRNYDSRPVEQEKIDCLLECVRVAPSAVNFQPCVFYVVTDQVLLAQLQDCYNRDWFKTAPMCIVACGNHQQAWHRKLDGKDHTDIDVAIAVDHLTLAAVDMGLGSCWICNFDAQKCAQVLDLPEGVEPIAMVPIGYAATDERPLKKRKAHDELFVYKK